MAQSRHLARQEPHVPGPRTARRAILVTVARWTCPNCARSFGRTRQGHECAPALTFDEYFSTGPSWERPIVDAVLAHLRGLGQPVEVEAVSVGIFCKGRRTYIEMRPMKDSVALSFALDRRIEHPRLSRKPAQTGSSWVHFVRLRTPEDVDDVVRAWITESHDLFA